MGLHVLAYHNKKAVEDDGSSENDRDEESVGIEILLSSKPSVSKKRKGSV